MANKETYITAAFRSSYKNEAYLFLKNKYVLVDYAPGNIKDKLIRGPLLISAGFPSLKGTTFVKNGIDCAFASHSKNEAFIFSGNICAYIDYAPHSTYDRIIRGPMTITAMFPFLKGTAFESGIDAAFESTKVNQAYLFKGNMYARINYSSSHLMFIRPINERFPSLRNTIFGRDFDAAFASHITDEAYLFRGDYYARINFAPGTTGDCIMDGIKEIYPTWPSLRGIVPRK